MIDEKELTGRLTKEGYTRIYVWTDLPGTRYPDHSHTFDGAHIILKGSMDLTIAGVKRHVGPGDRFDIKKNTRHSAHVGPEGCRYVVGEKNT